MRAHLSKDVFMAYMQKLMKSHIDKMTGKTKTYGIESLSGGASITKITLSKNYQLVSISFLFNPDASATKYIKNIAIIGER